MFDQLDGDDLYAELIMLRTNDPRAFILVEGPTDCAVLDRFIDTDCFTTVPAHGKQRALDALAITHNTTSLTAVYAILDQDWVHILEDPINLDTVVYTDFYDLDACIFFTAGVYEAIAASHCTDLSFKHGTPGCTHQDITNACMNLALPVGVLRYLSRRDGLGLDLRDFPLGQVTRNGAHPVDLTQLVTLACQRARKDPTSHAALPHLLLQEIAQVSDPARYCSGHDLAKAFSLLAKRQWASKAGHDTIERAARAAYPHDAFRDSGIGQSYTHWVRAFIPHQQDASAAERTQSTQSQV
ncbi:hypothetical protein [Streptomyces hydrogenans]|uniref:hypothetical protein n=1 Tax=Streptomyces hydrogenans TaxID=1873719 RepID=UPI0036D0BCC4